MAEDAPTDSKFKERECRKWLALIESVSPVIGNGLRERIDALDPQDAWIYLSIVSQLVRTGPEWLWIELIEQPSRLYDLSELAQIRLMRRALSGDRFVGISSERIRRFYKDLRDAAVLAEDLGKANVSETYAFLARRLLQLVSLIYLESRGLRFERSGRAPVRATVAGVPRPCIRPPAERRPTLRLVRRQN